MRTDRASRVTVAPLERVYAALVDPEALTVWLTPEGMSATFERRTASPTKPSPDRRLGALQAEARPSVKGRTFGLAAPHEHPSIVSPADTSAPGGRRILDRYLQAVGDEFQAARPSKLAETCRHKISGGEMTECMIEANGVELCTEPFGDPTDAAILLVMGLGGSMLWWDDEFCRMLADAGRFVIRYDHRDTGRSVTYEPGRPGYSGDDMVADAVGVLDAYGVGAAHMVGVSAGGAFALLLALDFPDRVESLVLISTSPATPGDRDLPSPTERFGRFVATAQVDWSDSESVIEYLVDFSHMLAGDRRPFDEDAHHALIRRDVERAHDIAALQNHDVIPESERSREALSAISAPTLVIHGTADPMFPLRHGEALAAEIPGARLLLVDGAGHGVDQADWDTIVAAIVEHTT
jgi:pimeloyl-ACP methyl ester carboxylesterase